MSLLEKRDNLVQTIVRREITRFLLGTRQRTCLSCGSSFDSKCRWHFLCRKECRKEWYRGILKPRKAK